MASGLSYLKQHFYHVAGVALLASAVPLAAQTGNQEADQTLSLHNLHTGETLTVTYKKGDRYLPEALTQINHILRDHRRDEVNTINPLTLDRLHDVGEVIKQRYPQRDVVFEVISGYRSPLTNTALRRNGGEQAEQSRHMIGDAIDMRVNGISTRELRDIVWCTGSGGTGYYANDGFVHIDSGRQRFWPAGWNPHTIKCQDI